jgi:hypothetical protein
MNWLSELARRLNKLLHRRRHYRHWFMTRLLYQVSASNPFVFGGAAAALLRIRAPRVLRPRAAGYPRRSVG